MKLIVGLGNPGEKYEKTRHNLGFMVLEKFLQDFESAKMTVWKNEPKFKCETALIEWQPKIGQLEKVVLAKPKTYMNNSGLAIKLLTSYFSLFTSDVWVIHDDIDLPLGSLKIRFGGSSAGHKGVQSIIDNLGTDKFWRFRMGIGEQYQKSNIKDQKIRNVDEYVLNTFKGQERGKVKDLIKKGSKAIQTGLEDSLEAAMNRFNTK
ncbi:MAG: aminoacyl-tRNA hydrolase [Candidatus Levyibacteriota bacterium]